MGKVRTKAEDKRTPQHSRDAKRPSKGGKGQRDASTVRCIYVASCLSNEMACQPT